LPPEREAQGLGGRHEDKGLCVREQEKENKRKIKKIADRVG
jgi:hypothetical protein